MCLLRFTGRCPQITTVGAIQPNESKSLEVRGRPILLIIVGTEISRVANEKLSECGCHCRPNVLWPHEATSRAIHEADGVQRESSTKETVRYNQSFAYGEPARCTDSRQLSSKIFRFRKGSGQNVVHIDVSSLKQPLLGSIAQLGRKRVEEERARRRIERTPACK
jgi:hypothetical protein